MGVGQVVVAVTVAALALGGCARDPAVPRVTSGAPDATDSPAPRAGRIWFEVLGVSTDARRTGQIDVADDSSELRSLWESYALPGAPPTVDLERHVVVFYARAEDACPDDLVALTWIDRVLEPTWLPPPGGCEEPLIPTSYGVEVHRGDLGTSATLVLREHPGHGGDVTETFRLPAYDGPPSPAAPPVPTQPDDATVGALFADHPVRPCSEVNDPRRREEPVQIDVTRDQRLDVMVALQDYGAAHADTFGFLYLDHAAGGVWTIGFNGDVEGHRATLAERIPDVEIVVTDAPFTQADLEAAAAPLRDAMGRDVVGVSGFSVGLTRVEVIVLEPTRATLDELARWADVRRICVDAVFRGVPAGSGD